jgi:hypothetical protein
VGNEVEAFERATRRSRTIKIVLVFLVVCSPLIYLGYKNYAKRAEIQEHRDAYAREIALTAEDKTELAAAIPRARKAIQDAGNTFVNVVTPQKLEALEDSGQPCPYRITGPSMGAGESYIKYGSIDMNYFGNASYTLFAPGVPITPPLAYDLGALEEIAKKAAAKTADKNDLARVKRLERSMDDFLFVVGEQTEPMIVSDSYMPGELAGFAYLYSWSAAHVVCFTALAAQNREQIEIEYSHMEGNYADADMKKKEAARGVLQRDLQVQIRTAIAARLHATL